ncbi:30S ribosomal protein S16 [Patescibacteria group bacterium]|nr:30S ribosomal protein S16 [Patescibacteria group bacterium]
MLKIRLQRVGRKHDPSFRIVLTDSKNSSKSGNFLEVLGNYDPRKNVRKIISGDRVKELIGQGAQVSDTVHNILVSEKVIEGNKINVLPKKSPVVNEKAVAEAKEKEEAKAKAEAEKKAQKEADEKADSEQPIVDSNEDVKIEEIKEEIPVEIPAEEISVETPIEEVSVVVEEVGEKADSEQPIADIINEDVKEEISVETPAEIEIPIEEALVEEAEKKTDSEQPIVDINEEEKKG